MPEENHNPNVRNLKKPQGMWKSKIVLKRETSRQGTEKESLEDTVQFLLVNISNLHSSIKAEVGKMLH